MPVGLLRQWEVVLLPGQQSRPLIGQIIVVIAAPYPDDRLCAEVCLLDALPGILLQLLRQLPDLEFPFDLHTRSPPYTGLSVADSRLSRR